MGLAKTTNCDGCGDFGKTRKIRSLDQHLCSDCAKERSDLRKQFVPITDLEEARVEYQRLQAHGQSKGKLPDHDILRVEFESDCTSFAEVGNRYGLTRERVRQIYMRYFSTQIPRRPDGHTRQKVCTRKTRVLKKTERREQLFFGLPVASALKSVTETLNLKVQVIPARRVGWIISINNKRCAVYSCKGARQFAAKRPYWSFRFNPSTLKHSEFVICVAQNNEEFRFFVIPTGELPLRFFETGKMSAYIPKEGYDPKGKGRRSDFFDFLKYENAWHLLKPSEDEKTAPAVPALPVSSSPVS